MLTHKQIGFLTSIQKEYEKGFLFLNNYVDIDRSVTFYGGANIQADSRVYKEILDLGNWFRDNNYVVVTGGGPGIMTAALLGDDDENINSIGYKILGISNESNGSGFDYSVSFNHFPVRKHFLRNSNVFIIAPGGFGTLDEMMELIDLVKTNKIDKPKIYLYGKDFWSGLLSWLRFTCLQSYNTINESDLNLFKIVDSIDEVKIELQQ